MKKLSIVTTSAVAIASIIGAAPAFAAGGPSHGRPSREHRPAMVRPGAGEMHPYFGKVTAISGSVITMTTVGPTSTTYTVDASAAKFMKGRGGAGALSDISVGNVIGVQGALTGTNIAATTISVNGRGPESKTEAHIPMIAGKITSITGNTFTIDALAPREHGAATSTASFTITVTDATTYKKEGGAAALSDLSTGAVVSIRGTIDPAAHTATASDVMIHGGKAPEQQKKPGLLKKISNFFHKKK